MTETNREVTWKAVVDRIEAGTAVILIGDQEVSLDVPISLLPPGTGEGDHFSVTWQADPQARDAAAGRVSELLRRLTDQSPPSDKCGP